MSRSNNSSDKGSKGPITLTYGMVGTGPVMEAFFTQIRRAAGCDYPVLIRGPWGSGTDRVAEAIHLNGRRATKPFQTVTCAELVGEQGRAALVGYRAGAFMGADRDHPGIFASAEGGTVFLDELGDLALSFQPILHRPLDTGEFRTIGEVEMRKLDLRFIAATHLDLAEMVRSGSIRRDSISRVNVLNISVPPLGAHLHDVPALLSHLTACEPIGEGVSWSSAAIEAVMTHLPPGEVDGLRARVQRSLVQLQDEKQIDLRHLDLDTPSAP